MPRYIDADLILPEMEGKLDMQELYLPVHFQEFIVDEIPTADVAPARHGRWNKWNYAPNRKAIFLDSACEQYKTLGYPHRIILAFQCSECNMVSMVDKSHGKYNFCPNCGAKMDGKENE